MSKNVKSLLKSLEASLSKARDQQCSQQATADLGNMGEDELARQTFSTHKTILMRTGAYKRFLSLDIVKLHTPLQQSENLP